MLVPLTRGLYTIVDLDEYERTIQKNWWATPLHKRSKAQYVVRRATKLDGHIGEDKHIYLHRVILNLADDDPREPDHRNRNGLDNRRSNLRIGTCAQNMANRGIFPSNTSGFKGVGRHSGRWRARAYRKGNRIIIGDYNTPEEAARAYDEFVFKVHGEFAALNFPR